MFKRPGRPSDHFPPPFANPEAAKAVFGAAPPDMSDLAKARGFPRPFPLFIFDAVTQYQEQGPDYIVAILNGFTHPDDPNWNLYFPGHHIAMPKPLTDGAIKYTDGTAPTLANYSRDVAAFLFWAAEPKLEERKAMGFRVVVFLIVFAGLLYFTKKRIWSGVQAALEGARRHASHSARYAQPSATLTCEMPVPQSVTFMVLDRPIQNHRDLRNPGRGGMTQIHRRDHRRLGRLSPAGPRRFARRERLDALGRAF